VIEIRWTLWGEALNASTRSNPVQSDGPGQEPPEADWVAAAQQGDNRAFERLYRLHVGKVYALCLRLIGEPVQAEILTQDVFVRAWEKLGTYAGRGAFTAWLRRLAVNVVVEDRRANSRRSRWLEPYRDLSDQDQESAGPETGAPVGFAPGRELTAPVWTEVGIDLDRAIVALPLGARLAFVLHDVIGFQHREIAELTGLAAGTIKAQLHRARALLRKALLDPEEVTGQ
jgi:RNA polymerase sigma-70 factor (ECF subfamily)